MLLVGRGITSLKQLAHQLRGLPFSLFPAKLEDDFTNLFFATAEQHFVHTTVASREKGVALQETETIKKSEIKAKCSNRQQNNRWHESVWTEGGEMKSNIPKSRFYIQHLHFILIDNVYTFVAMHTFLLKI